METTVDQYFVFTVRNSLYAVNAMVVSETFQLPEITPIEETPPHVAGVINLRGKIIPVMDLNILFGRLPARYLLEDGMLVINVNGQLTGIIVNQVRDVIKIRPGQLDLPPPAVPGEQVPPYVTAHARLGEEIIMILDHERLTVPAKHVKAPAEPELNSSESSHQGESFRAATPGTNRTEQTEFHRRSAELMKAAEDESLRGTEQVAVATLGGEYFGIDLKSVQEFSSITNLTPLPNCPEHVIGNMNLRGSILLVIDIRGLLGMPAGQLGSSSKVIVASLEEITVGIAVDEIHDIACIDATNRSPLPSSLSAAIEKFSRGTAHYESKAMTLLNMAAIIKEGNLAVDTR